MKTDRLIEVLLQLADRIHTERMMLTELDNAIGDGDHGINLDRGFQAVAAKSSAWAGLQPADVFKQVGMTLISTVGGASGPLYGTAFMYMARVLNGKDEITLADFLAALRSGAEGVAMRGKSKTGEKTMLDAMIPACDAMDSAAAQGKSPAEMLSDGVQAAWAGVAFTKTIAATKGRASYLGERSIGHQDPGATSFTVMLEEAAKSVTA